MSVRFVDPITLLNAANINSLDRGGNVYQSSGGGLFIDVSAAQIMVGMAPITYAGVANQAVTPSVTNFVYLTKLGALAISASAFPTDPHVPLAEVVTSGSAITAINDKRPMVVLPNAGLLHANMTAQATVGTTEETLRSFSLPAGLLALDGKAVEITAFGTTAANANNKSFYLDFGATRVVDSAAVAANNQKWKATAVVFRTGPATQKALPEYALTGTIALTPLAFATPAETMAGAITVALKALTPTAAGDLTCQGFFVKLL